LTVLLHGVGLVETRLIASLPDPDGLFNDEFAHGIRRLIAHVDEIHPALKVAHVEAHLVQSVDDIVLHDPAVHVEDHHLGAALQVGTEVEHTVGRVGVEAEFGQSGLSTAIILIFQRFYKTKKKVVILQ